ncbi:MAG: sugar transferase [Leptolyngbya sp. SIO3F4]|nr:sugar transferase [Leptolyngbya sp. SIO3F4]
MKTSTILLNTPLVFDLPSENVDPSAFENCSLIWDQDALTVAPMMYETKIRIPALKSKAWLNACLRHSPITRVYLDPCMEESVIRSWIDICNATDKKVYLNVPSALELPQAQRPGLWQMKRLVDWLAAAVLLTALSPIMILLAILVKLDSAGPVFFKQWRVGYQGELFQIRKFRSMQANAEKQHHEVMGKQVGLHKLKEDPRITRVGRWLRKYSLDELPQLINVLRGEMSLVGPRPWALYDAVRIEPALQGRLKALPGITGPWQVSTRANELDLYAVTCRDLAYLQQWSLFRDLRVLILTVPKALLGVGAY